MTTLDLGACCWRGSDLGSALSALVAHCKLAVTSVRLPAPPAELEADQLAFERWLERAAVVCGVEAEHVESSFSGYEQLLRGCAPALLRIPGVDLEADHGEPLQDAPFLAVVCARRGQLSVLGPDLTLHRVGLAELRSIVLGRLFEDDSARTDDLLLEVGLVGEGAARAREHLLRERLGEVRIGGCFMVRKAQHGSFARRVLPELARPFFTLLASHVAEYALWIGSWWLLGRGVFRGYLDPGWLSAWSFMLLAIVPFRMIGTSAQAKLSITSGQLLKERLLSGVFSFSPDALRAEGAGSLLGRVVESEAVEALALSGGLLGLVSVVELAISASLLGGGASATANLLLLAGSVALTCWLARTYYLALDRWGDARVALTHDVVEKMVGHRTRRVQQAPSRAHEGEDEALTGYIAGSRRLDRQALLLTTLIPGAFLATSLLALTQRFAHAPDQDALAIVLGGILLAHGALTRLLAGAVSMGRALVAWQKVLPLVEAARPSPLPGSPWVAPCEAPGAEASGPAQVGLEAAGLTFRHAMRHEPVLRDCNLQIGVGERVVLTGPSGSGKSTLAATLAGLRAPDAGLLLLHGLDRHALGSETWRRSIVLTPQLHENHVVSESFAFNLFMGARWPVGPRALEDAEKLCGELGLSELLARMPGRMLQLVGETGWQLSHGERSRLFIARALLQRPEVLIMDESFGALDPDNLQRVLTCVEQRATTIMVIAHP